MLACFDAQLGRIVSELKRSGQYDNTLVLFIRGDNGSSGEGGPSGALNYAARVSGSATAAQEQDWALTHLDSMGGPESCPIGPGGWASAMNTPYPYCQTAAVPLAAGQHRVKVVFTVDGPGFGKGGRVQLLVDGQAVADGRLARTVPFKFAAEDGTPGRDTGTALTGDYRLPFAFTGKLGSVVLDLGPVQPPPGL
ncbi:MAG: sulfatase-like hydrolase/transferase [Novosphingobium sp.]